MDHYSTLAELEFVVSVASLSPARYCDELSGSNHYRKMCAAAARISIIQSSTSLCPFPHMFPVRTAPLVQRSDDGLLLSLMPFASRLLSRPSSMTLYIGTNLGMLLAVFMMTYLLPRSLGGISLHQRYSYDSLPPY